MPQDDRYTSLGETYSPLGEHPHLARVLQDHEDAVYLALQNPRLHPAGLNPLRVPPTRRNLTLAGSHSEVAAARRQVKEVVLRIVGERWEDWNDVIQARRPETVSASFLNFDGFGVASRVAEEFRRQEALSRDSTTRGWPSQEVGICVLPVSAILANSPRLRDSLRSITLGKVSPHPSLPIRDRRTADHVAELCFTIAMGEYENRGPVRIHDLEKDTWERRQLRQAQLATITEFSPPTVVAAVLADDGAITFSVTGGRRRLLAHLLSGKSTMTAHVHYALSREAANKEATDEAAIAELEKLAVPYPVAEAPFSVPEPFEIGISQTIV